MLCSKCGNPVPEHGRFCPICGTTAQQSQAQHEPAQYSQQPPAYNPQPSAYSHQPPVYTPQTAVFGQQPPAHGPHPPLYGQQPPAYAPQPPMYAPQPPVQTPQPPLYDPPSSAYDPLGAIYDRPAPQTYAQRPPAAADQPYAQAYPPPFPQQMPAAAHMMQEPEPQPAKKSNAGRILAMSGAIAGLLGAVLLVLYTLGVFGGASEIERTVNAAITSASDEVTVRLDGTPFTVVDKLSKSLESGSTALTVTHSDYWGSSTNMSFELLSDAQTGEYAAMMDLFADGMNIDLEFFLNDERVAIGSSYIPGNDYYGITFETFQEDLSALSSSLGLDSFTMGMFTDYFDTLEGMMDFGSMDIDIMSAIETLAGSFEDSLDMSVERVELNVSGTTVRCRKLEINVTKDSLLVLLNGINDMIGDISGSAFGLGDNPFLQDAMYDMDYAVRELQRELRNLITEFERNYTGNISISIYVDNNDRLLRIEFDADMSFDNERAQIGGLFDFGGSAFDRWEFEFYVFEQGQRQSVRLVWDYAESSDSITNSLTLYANNEIYGTLASSWDTRSGDFIVSAKDMYGLIGSISGNLRISDNQYTLRFDSLPMGYGEDLLIELSGRQGSVTIPQIEYINLDAWGDMLLPMLSQYMFSGFDIGSAFGFDYYDMFGDFDAFDVFGGFDDYDYSDWFDMFGDYGDIDDYDLSDLLDLFGDIEEFGDFDDLFSILDLFG